jgi:uncharacterized phiE125 gp8 family phage protein
VHGQVVDHLSEDDTLLDRQIVAARQVFERETGYQLLTAEWTAILDGFPRSARVPGSAEPVILGRRPLVSVEAIRYRDADGASQTWDAAEYLVEATTSPRATYGRIFPKVAFCYPDTDPLPGSVEIDFTAGYGTAAAVPEDIRHALLVLVSHFYEHREAVVLGAVPMSLPLGLQHILSGHRGLVLA